MAALACKEGRYSGGRLFSALSACGASEGQQWLPVQSEKRMKDAEAAAPSSCSLTSAPSAEWRAESLFTPTSAAVGPHVAHNAARALFYQSLTPGMVLMCHRDSLREEVKVCLCSTQLSDRNRLLSRRRICRLNSGGEEVTSCWNVDL